MLMSHKNVMHKQVMSPVHFKADRSENGFAMRHGIIHWRRRGSEIWDAVDGRGKVQRGAGRSLSPFQGLIETARRFPRADALGY
jgi:hypothetical protein